MRFNHLLLLVKIESIDEGRETNVRQKIDSREKKIVHIKYGSTEFWVVNDAFAHGTWLTFSVGETTDEKNMR